jgi:hypothetical protein
MRRALWLTAAALIFALPLRAADFSFRRNRLHAAVDATSDLVQPSVDVLFTSAALAVDRRRDGGAHGTGVRRLAFRRLSA